MVVYLKKYFFIALKYSFYLSVFIYFLASCGSSAQPMQYESYSVKEGETVASIAKDYNISKATIYNLNPESRKGIKVNSVLILPARKTDSDSKPSDDARFHHHKVEAGETLYGLSKQYEVSVDAIKKHNKELYDRALKKGETILIPKNLPEDPNQSDLDLPSGTQAYTVSPKETKYGIARKFGITIDELEKLNPHIKEELPVGTTLIVPVEEAVAQGEVDTALYELYEVKAREGFYRLKTKFGISKEEIIKLNPYAADGLKEGMILKIPKKSVLEEIQVVDLETKIENKKLKNIALMLPFHLPDSIQAGEDLIKKDPTLRIALDFYSGALMAAEFAKEKGISVQLNIFDTGPNESNLSNILNGNNFENTQAVIGPLLQRNVEQTAQKLESENIPVFSPLSNRNLNMRSNLFQTIPTTAVLQQAMINYLHHHGSEKNILFISDGKHRELVETASSTMPTAKIMVVRNNFIKQEEILPHLTSGNENWVVVSSDNPILISSVVNTLNGILETKEIRLFALDKNDAYEWDEISNSRLARLEFTFPSVNKNDEANRSTAFYKEYYKKYGVWPNRFVTRGFDVTYDVILRLAAEKDIYESLDPGIETVYTENKFRYDSSESGYANQAVYILKFTDDLKFEVIE